MELTEGQTGDCVGGSDDIVYPEINTCMTLTVVYGGPSHLVGGHFSLPVEGMKGVAPATVVHDMKARLPAAGTVSAIYLIGARDVWKSGDIKTLYDFIGTLDTDFELLHEFDTTSWKSVNVTFERGGAIRVAPTASGKVGEGTAPTQW